MATPRHTPRLLVLVGTDTAPDDPRLGRWHGALPPARQARIAALTDATARRQSLLGIGLLLAGLRRLGHDASALASLHEQDGGKPRLDLPLDFSLSHCAGRVVCALCEGGPVGVDVEPLGDARAADFPHYLHPAEQAWAGAEPARFYALWTRKEAVVKAAGDGLLRLPEVRVDIDKEQAVYGGAQWRTASLEVGAQHVASLAGAVSAPPPQIEVFR
ncbi:MAG: 4'-phosphopantetheinyl transferase superfamily protein [Pseudomonadota bacterium]